MSSMKIKEVKIIFENGQETGMVLDSDTDCQYTWYRGYTEIPDVVDPEMVGEVIPNGKLALVISCGPKEIVQEIRYLTKEEIITKLKDIKE